MRPQASRADWLVDSRRRLASLSGVLRTVDESRTFSVVGRFDKHDGPPGTLPNTGPGESAQVRRACPTKPAIARTMPSTSQGSGFKCWSQPEAVAVCQQVVPGPSRCTHAT